MYKITRSINFFCLIFLASVISDLSVNIASAEELIIEDTNGYVRHISDISANATVRFTLSDTDGKAVEGTLVNITHKDTSQKRQSISIAGIVEFLDVPAGKWIVSTENANLLFTQVGVYESNQALASASTGGTAGGTTSAATTGGAAAAASTSTMIGVGILAAGGITGIAVAVNEANDDDDNEDGNLSP